MQIRFKQNKKYDILLHFYHYGDSKIISLK